MTRVKMNAKHEYEFIANFKVMQNVFKAKRLEKVRTRSPWIIPPNPFQGIDVQRNTCHLTTSICSPSP